MLNDSGYYKRPQVFKMLEERKENRAIYYIFDNNLIKECDRIPVVKNRASMVHSLIESYELLQHMTILPSIKATPDDLKLFHSSAFVEFMREANDINSEEEEKDEQEEYGLCYDCTPVVDLFDLMLTIAGGTLSGAESLMNLGGKIAINWCGGWHHAQRDEAEGFCYVNDIVIAIERLRQKYQRIIYIDLDIHHGNGVENAYTFSKRVLTLSFHKYEAGFYPGTGSVNDVGCGNGRGYAVNVPMKEGVSDDSLCYLFENIAPAIFDRYQPECVVVQCGSDCINGDPLGQSNITSNGAGKCVSHILEWDKPTLFLGGGGYHLANTARLWTYLTAIITGQKELLSEDIPDHDYFLKYGPDYEVTITRGNQKDTNSREYLKSVVDIVKENLERYGVSSL